MKKLITATFFVFILTMGFAYGHIPTYDDKGFPERVDCMGLENENTCNVDIMKIETDFRGWGDDPTLVDWQTFEFGPSNGIPIAGDWNGDGTDTIGLYQPETGTFSLKNSNEEGAADISFRYGPGDGIPIAGDWNGDGTDTIGLYQPETGTFSLKNSNEEGAADISFRYGPGDGIPIAGDWNGDGTDTIGLYQPETGIFFLKDKNESGVADKSYSFGSSGLVPITGDWNGDGIDSVGLYQEENKAFFLKNNHVAGYADIIFPFGPPQTKFVLAGNWDLENNDTVGVYFDRNFLLRMTNNQTPNLWDEYKTATFLPRIINANLYSTVVWQNHDNVTHNISGISPLEVKNLNLDKLSTRNIGYSSGNIEPGETTKLTFEQPGTFHYLDFLHPEMNGMIRVFEEPPVMNAKTEMVISTITSTADWNEINNSLVTGIAFTPDGKMFFTEHHGDVKIIQDGKLIETPFLKMKDEINFPFEDGKTIVYKNQFPVQPHGWRGVTVDPDYEENHYVYLTRMFKVLDGPYQPGYQNRHTQLIRVTDVNNTATDLKILIEDVPGIEHAGGPIVFGDDGKIYFATGDNANGIASQDISQITGKILRINPDGSIPNDNPFSDSPVFTLGHREVFGLAKHPFTGKLYSVDNGPDSGDEINLLKPGGNYGWPVYNGNELVTKSMFSDDEEYVLPILEWKSVLGPSNAIFYQGEKFEQLRNKLLVGTWNLGMMRMVTLTDNFEQVESDKLIISGYKPIIAITESPDGYIYFSTIDSIERIVDVNYENFETPTTTEYRTIFVISAIIIIIISIIAYFLIKIRKNVKKRI